MKHLEHLMVFAILHYTFGRNRSFITNLAYFFFYWSRYFSKYLSRLKTWGWLLVSSHSPKLSKPNLKYRGTFLSTFEGHFSQCNGPEICSSILAPSRQQTFHLYRTKWKQYRTKSLPSVKIRYVAGSGKQIIQIILTRFQLSQFETSTSASLPPDQLLGSLRGHFKFEENKCNLCPEFFWHAYLLGPELKVIFLDLIYCHFYGQLKIVQCIFIFNEHGLLDQIVWERKKQSGKFLGSRHWPQFSWCA